MCKALTSRANIRIEDTIIIGDNESSLEGAAVIPQTKQRTAKKGKAEISHQRSQTPVDGLSHVEELKVKSETYETIGEDVEDNGGVYQEDDVASGKVGNQQDGGYDEETGYASGENVTIGGEDGNKGDESHVELSAASRKRTLDEFVEASVATSKNIESITVAIELALDTINEFDVADSSDESHIGEENGCSKRCRLTAPIKGQYSASQRITNVKLLLRFTREKIRDLNLEFDQLSEEAFTQHSSTREFL